MPFLIQAAVLPPGNPPAIQQGMQDSTQALRGHCMPTITKKYNCAEGTIELSAFTTYLFTGQTIAETVLWSTGETAHKITVTPPGAWSWDATFTGCEVYHLDVFFSADSLTIFPVSIPELVSPADGATGIHAFTKLTWRNIPNATDYQVDVARDPSFSPGSMHMSITVSDSSTTFSPALTNFTVYYWRVKALNNCSESAFSPVFAFQSGRPHCDQVFSSTDVPKAFQAPGNQAISILNMPSSREMLDVNVSVVFEHPQVGDVSASLVSPTLDTILLFDRPGFPADPNACTNDNGNLTFDQQSSQAASVLEAQCISTPPAIKGTFKPLGDLTTLNGKNVQGQWQMILTDHNDLDAATIQSWKLTLCVTSAAPTAILLANFPLYVVTAESEPIVQQNLELELTFIPSDGIYTLLSMPQHGTLYLNGIPMTLGKQFTQEHINLGLVVYEHNGDLATEDEFRFDALDNNAKAWLHDQVFHIVILPEEFSATAVISKPIACYGDENGEITVNATGMGGIYTYSLNGGLAQNSPVFSNLPEGTYIATVFNNSGISITTFPITLENPPVLDISLSVTCDHFMVEVSNGIPPLQYSLDGGAFQTDSQFNNLSNGVYLLTVQDAIGCESSDSVTITYLPFSLSAEMLQPKCAGNNNGKITALTQGGQSPFTYTLSGGPTQSSNVFNNLLAGVYQLSALDNQGCKVVVEVQLEEPAPLLLSVSLTSNNISLQASGGTGMLTYSLNGMPFQANNQFLNVPNGTHQVRVRDANGCTTVTTVTVNVFTGIIQGPTSICAGNLMDITIVPTGGTPPYAYQLNGGAFQTSNVFSNLGAGTYSVVIRDSNNATTTIGPLTTLEYPNPEASVTVVCREAMLSISGGTPPYTSNPSAGQLMFLANGSYTVTVSDAIGCKVETAFEVDLQLTATNQIVDVLCYGDSTGVAVIEGMGGIQPYAYSFFGGPFGTENTFDSLPAGWFYYHVKDSLGCEEQLWLEVKQPDSAALNTIIIGDSILAVAIGGTGAYIYRLNGGPGQSSGLFENLIPGNYVVSAIDEVNCELVSDNLGLAVNGTFEQPVTWKTQIWPNPGNGLFRLLLQNAPDKIHAEIYTSSGQLIQHQDFNPVNGRVETVFHLEYFPAGTYLLRLTDEQISEGVFLKKVNVK